MIQFRAAAVLVTLLASITGAQVPAVNAPAGVQTASLSTLVPLAPATLWHQLDGMDFWAVPLAPPANYYSATDTSSPTALRSSLHGIISGHRVFPYSTGSKPSQANNQVDTWDIIALSCAHPDEPRDVLDYYWNNQMRRQYAGKSTTPHYDREHTWPKSLGFPDDTTANAAYSDCHHLVAAYSTYNQSRSNKPYGEHSPDPQVRRPTAESNGRGGSLTSEPESSNYSFTDVWQTWAGRRGDVARGMFYMDVRYEGGNGEPDLVLTDDESKIKGLNVWQSGGKAYMGLLTALLKWNREDPVDDLERRHNAVVYLFQQNRNPFIDHPEWVGFIFAGEPIGTPTGGGGGGGRGTPVAVTPWINEFHYDDDGADDDEFVEIAGRAGTDLTGWTVVAYNGGNGKLYKTMQLPAVIPDHGGGFGCVAIDAVGLQNGAPDGLALIDPGGHCVEFLSYEGRFTASDGPASDMTSEDVGVSEPSTTPAGHSLQRTGSGHSASGFQWDGPAPSSRGLPNAGQALN